MPQAAASFKIVEKKTGEAVENKRTLKMGIIGLGRIGGSLALQALEKGIEVSGVDPGGVSGELLEAGISLLDKPADLEAALEEPRIVFLYIPSGPPVDHVIEELRTVLKPGDVLIDGGNSYWRDSIRRQQELTETGIQFIDMGTSGGLSGARTGACFMAGGEETAFKKIEPLLERLCAPGGYVHAGPPGAGHFTKLVHNGIEFGMLQAIGEGMDLLEKYPDKLPIGNILKAWKNGSVIRSWLIELMEAGYKFEGGMSKVPAYVEDTGEVNWLVEDALHMEVPIPVIAASVMQLFLSRDEEKNWARAIAMMRHGFGGHPYGPNENLKLFRRRGKAASRDAAAGVTRTLR